METGQQTKDALGSALVARTGELAISAQAAKAQALVQAAYVMAMQRPRNIEDARLEILSACRRPVFAETARYSKPIGKAKIIGPSVRFAETAIQAMTNIGADTSVIYEDDEKFVINVRVTDFQKNISYGQDITVKKQVERRELKSGQEAISQRENSQGAITYLVAATEDEVKMRIQAEVSKMLRNSGLRLIPQDIIEEAMDVVAATIRGGGKDPEEYRRKWLAAFFNRGIKAEDLEKYFGMSSAQFGDQQFEEMAAIFQSLKDGVSTWAEYVGANRQPEKASVSLDDVKEGKVETHTEPGEPQPGMFNDDAKKFSENARKMFYARCTGRKFSEDKRHEKFDEFAKAMNITDWPDIDNSTKYAEVVEWINKNMPTK